MGRRQGFARLLIAPAALLLCSASVPIDFPLRDARWLQSPDVAADLTRQPAECRSRYTDPKLQRSADIGRIAFSAPLLLGGQAARVGLSCSTCHRNGRTNPHFHFPGLSGDPGTADVTASLMSSHRGDDIFNPKPIPDLAGDPAKLKISRDPRKDDLKRFIHGLITQEFDGPEPPAAVLAGIVAYVQSLSPGACPGTSSSPVELNSMLDNVDLAVRLAEDNYVAGDQATARVLIAAARSMLGSIDERFKLPGLEANRATLLEADTGLKAIELANNASAASFRDWRRAWRDQERLLREAEPRSLFSEAVLRRQLGG
jgi:hypothetical protein